MEGVDWCVVKFQYKNPTTFCFVCGSIGNTEQSNEVLFVMDEDYGSRGWGLELCRQGDGSNSHWLREESGVRRNPSKEVEGGSRSHSSVAHADFQATKNQSVHVMHEGRTNPTKAKEIIEGNQSLSPICDPLYEKQ